MVDSLVASVAEGVLKKVLSIAASEVALAWGYKEKLADLCKTLDIIRAKLQDAERQKEKKQAVMEWLKQLKDVVVEADDVLDEVHYEALRREVKARDRMTRKVPSLSISFKKPSFRREMGHRIEKINKRLSEIYKRANVLELKDVVSHGSPGPETDSYLDEFKIVGREDEEHRIVRLLTESISEEKLTIVPIVGMGGIGKTTLAKSVFNNQKIKQHFEVTSWLCVSVKVDVKTLLAKIYESLSGEGCQVQTREILITNLRNKLGAKRYLLVLDDVWDEKREHWDDFRSCMLKVNSINGSGILVTTRNSEIRTNAMKDVKIIIVIMYF